MKRWLIFTALGCLLLGGPILLDSCRKTSVMAGLPSGSPLEIPNGFPQPAVNFTSDPLTEEGFLLGRKLFYDGRLSIDGNFPCASCHQPIAAFTTFEHDRSHGYNHSHTIRNAPGLFNLAWNPSVYLQDGSGKSLHQIYQDHITNPSEMAETMGNVVAKLKADTAYKRMFGAAFGNTPISSETIFRGLTQFLMKLVSGNSRYDRVIAGKEQFTSDEEDGYRLFQSNCSTCHRPPLFTDYQFHNIGLTVNTDLNDLGRMRVTGNPSDSLKFRTPTLRNVDFTSYYFHDGRTSLPIHVIQHYRTGIQQSSTLDPLLKNGIALTDAQQSALVSFISTLSDSSFLNNPRFRQ